MINILHTRGDNPCMEVAFFSDYRPKEDDRIKSKHCYHLDGKQAKDGERILCESCGFSINGADISPEGGYDD